MKGISMKKFYSLFWAIFIAVSFNSPVWANEVTIPKSDASLYSQGTSYLPVALSSTAGNYGGPFSVSQQLYFASELSEQLSEHSSKTITAIKFYSEDASSMEDYTTVNYVARKLRVWINETEITAFPTSTTTPNFVDPGTKVFSSKNRETDSVRIMRGNNGYTIPFDTPFEWDGTSNIIVTVFDSTGVKSGMKTTHLMMKTLGVARYLHLCTTASAYADAGWNMNNLTDFTAISSSDRGYVNKITFVFAPAPETAPATPDDLEVSVTAYSATLTWSAVEGATSYNLQQSANGTDGWRELSTGETGTSYTWTGLSPESTQYVRICAVNTSGSSDWSESVEVTTDAVHEHNGVSFDRWSNASAMPTSGNYYLANDVELSANTSLTGNLNLCLNGHKINTYVYNIVVPAEKKLAIYDNEGEGQIYGYYVGNNGSYYGLISVVGELVLSEGTVQNLSEPERSGDISYAIYNNGTFKLSGAPTITGNTAAIHLNSYKYITIESDKPLTNSTPYTVNSFGQVITSGWANMSGANPANFFTSAKSGYPAVILDGGEAKLVNAISLSQDDSEETFNDKISGKTNIVITVSLDRSFTSASYNTICLPFNLTDAQLQEVFGSGYDLQAFQSADLDGETLLLSFSQVPFLTAGVPYLIQPSINVENPTFNGVTIPSGLSATPAAVETDYIDFQGVYSPKNVGSGENILFVGANNELFWNNNASGELKGFRAFFTANGNAAQAIRARIVKKDNAATAIDNVQGDDIQCKKVLQNGQLLIQHNGTMYNVQGQMVK